MVGRESRRRSRRGLGEETTLLASALALVLIAGAAWLALAAGNWVSGQPVIGHPVRALLAVSAGRHPWPVAATVLFIGLLAGGFAAGVAVWQRYRAGSEIDAAARTMQPPHLITMARARDNLATNQRLLRDAPAPVRAMPGPPLGRTVIGGIELFVPAELGVTIAAGTRTGKTMAWAVAAVLGAWGACLATSNKPDLYRHTVYGRERRGRVWLCDLQAVTGQPVCGFWVNLLTQVTGLPAARKLAGFFVSGSMGSASQAANAKVDSYFDGGAQELLALYVFAAACAGGDLLHVAEWLGRDQDETPALILRAHGHTRPAERIVECQGLYARQRDGLYDMARRFLNVLSDPGYARMVTPPQRLQIKVREASAAERALGAKKIVVYTAELESTHQLPEFVPSEFVTSSDTLYALSMAGPDGATPLTSALVGQILEAGLAVARARPDGRLAVPLLGVLDEAANCARIGELPSYYTYAGGCGIVLMTILQVLEQGEDLWGANGLATMRAQSIEVYGGGIAATGYLEHWVAMAGAHQVADRSRSRGAGGTNRTLTWRTEPILDVAILAALPKNRALVRLPNHGPVVVEKLWWSDTEHAPLVRASLDRFDKATQPLPGLDTTDQAHGEGEPS
ncbi:type IV secretory system conjugative DNA transfer family protein [Nocardia cyriacigeorgica]|uniref:type IV secretory system conjugative DNA transfer family protein n=1 Tax=Nocardia cyriacigeorgica TaxID=135487 RepID=UPI00189451A8|nr:TraM recognition domain-containing protein [Nocardia cyriacigeorgica]MBF6094999.1 TraM recognition domain-containing protein [Nocardia cyriacigeorgica]